MNHPVDTLSVEPSGGAVGAFATDVDLAKPLGPPAISALRQALGEHGVLFFRDQDLSPEQHVAFAEQFAPIVISRFFTPVPSHPKIAEVRKEPEQNNNIGGAWHTDHSYDRIPAMGSILLARELPPKGGDTLFASMYAAYETLSDDIKQTLAGLRALHSSRHVFGADAAHLNDPDNDARERFQNAYRATQEVLHPVVIRHPISGRRALYVNPDFTVKIDGWPESESRSLLDALFEHARRPEHQYRFAWADGSMAFWDNRATWHFAVNDYHGARRLMHRITLRGEALDA